MRKSLILFLRNFYFPIAIVIVTTTIQFTSLSDSLDFERVKIQTGQWWLLLTGHFSHLGWQHLILNNVALLVIWELFYRQKSAVISAIELLFLCAAVGLCIFQFNSEVEWYVGLSGALHGMFVIGISSEVFKKNILSMLVALGFIAKIIWEQTVGITTGVMFDEDQVLVDAHLYGALAGCVWITGTSVIAKLRSTDKLGES